MPTANGSGLVNDALRSRNMSGRTQEEDLVETLGSGTAKTCAQNHVLLSYGIRTSDSSNCGENTVRSSGPGEE